MNDIHKAVPNKDLKLFADDTNLFLFGSDLKILEAEANDCLKKLELWFYANKLSLNTEKTCYTAFKCNNKAQSDVLTFSLIINGKQINKVSSCKYLGVYIDDNFKWNEHIDYVYKKIVRFVGICYKLKGTVPKECLYKLYYAFIYPYIQYGVEVYVNSSKSALDKLSKANNKILRIILNKKFDTPNIDLYREFNVLPIPLLHESKLLQLIFKCYYFKNLLPEIFKSYFTTNKSIHQHRTRNIMNLHITSVNSTFGQRCSDFRGSKLWNELPIRLKQYSSCALFKKSIHTFLLWR